MNDDTSCAKARTSITIDPALLARVDTLASIEGVSRSFVMELAARTFLANYRLAQAREAFAYQQSWLNKSVLERTEREAAAASESLWSHFARSKHQQNSPEQSLSPAAANSGAASGWSSGAASHPHSNSHPASAAGVDDGASLGSPPWGGASSTSSGDCATVAGGIFGVSVNER
jgi:predicted transcriptional regulator